MPKVRRQYSGGAVATILDGPVGASSVTTFNVVGGSLPTGWPNSSSVPFFVVLSPQTSSEEKMLVTISGATLTIVSRALDGTSAGSHSSGASIYPVFTATDADEANELVSKYTTNGDIVVHGTSTVKTISTGGSGGNNKVLVADSTVADGGVKWASITADNIATDAITSVKILNNTIEYGDLAVALQRFLVPVGTIVMWGGATAPTGWLLCNGASTSGYTALASIVGATTPDMTGRFPLGLTGSGTGSTLRGTGGTNTIAETHLPAHAHSAGTLAADAVGNHGHTGGTDYAGEHNHTYTQTTVSQRTVFNGADQIDDVVLATATTNTSTAAVHFHAIGQDGAHGHTISGATANKGDGTAYFQPFVSVNYIIKHD